MKTDYDKEAIISFWNVFFDNVYKYPIHLWNKDDALAFLKTYGQRAPNRNITSIYNTECNKREYIFYMENGVCFKDLLSWSVDMYNSVMEKICEGNIENDISSKNIKAKDVFFICPRRQQYFYMLTLDDVEKWIEKGGYGVPRKNIRKTKRHVKKENDEDMNKKINIVRILKSNDKILKRKQYKKMAIVGILTAGIIIILYVIIKMIRKKINQFAFKGSSQSLKVK